MWRSIARSSLTRNVARNWYSSQFSQVIIPKSLNLPSSSLSFYCTFSSFNQNPTKTPFQNHHFFSHSSSISEFDTENHDSTSSEELESENGDTHVVSSSQELGLSPEFDGNDEINDTQIVDFSSNDQELDGINEEMSEIDVEKLEKLVSLLSIYAHDSLDSSLDNMDLTLNEEFVVRVFRSPFNTLQGDSLIRFFKWGLSRNDFKVTTLVLSEFARAICINAERKVAYAWWDLVKEIGEKENGVLNAEILNWLLSAFSRLGKGKATFEVFGKFEEFDCIPNVDSYYLTIQALCKRSFYDWASVVCWKMLDAGMIPESRKVGEIISYYCKGHMSKEAHAVYLAAKEQKKYPPQKAVNFLISCLSKVDETVGLAQEMLEDFSGDVRKGAINPFSWVIRGLCRTGDIEGAEKLLAKMIVNGPPPGNAVFNMVINALSKVGELEEAKEMVKLMESRGLKPDVYTYSVIISGYAKGGLMEEACKVLSMAKRKHSKLCPATFHTLIRGYCKLGEFDKAMKLLSQMKEYGVEPNVDEYNKLIQSLCLKNLDWKSAEKLLEEMKKKGLHLPGITRGLIGAVKELEQETIGSKEAQPKA